MFVPGAKSELFPATSRSRSRFATAVFCSLVTGALGTSTAVAVAASPACSKLVHTYVDRVERNLVSKATLKRWHDWGVGHPNWKPNPRLHRAKFKHVPQDVLSTVAIACPFIPAPAAEIALLQPDFNTFLLPGTAADFSGDTLTPPIVAPIPAYSTGTPGGYPAAGIGPVFGGGGSGGGVAPTGGSAPTGTTPTTGTTTTTPTTGTTVTTPVTTTPVTTPVTTTPVTTPVNTTPVDAPTPITPITTPVTTPVTPTGPVTPAPIPEPDSVVLTLTGLFAIGGFAYFQRRNLAVNR